MGCVGTVVRRPDELSTALRDARASSTPALIAVHVH
ncbi:hypothetical protein ACQPZQ_29710 [Pseudonocardia sp. CA-142604]